MEIDIKKLAKLSRLKIEENQIAGFEKDMAGIIGMVENLPEISGDGTLIDPSNPMKMREDVAENNYKRDELMKNATDVYAMTESHLAALLANFPEHANKVRLVTCYTGNRGIADPIGCGQTAYNNVARQLTTAIQAIIALMEQQE